MQLTELIELCQAALAEHGNLEVLVYSTEDIHTPDIQVHPTMLDDLKNKLVIR